jgi:hypothetical protein
MNARRYSPLPLLLAALAVALSVDEAGGQQAPGGHASPSFHWPETVMEIPAADKLPVPSLEAFLDELKPLGILDQHIAEFRFEPMEKSSVCLAATVDSSGREMFFFYVAVVCPDRQANSFRMTLVESDAPQVLGTELVDLSGDGIFELISKELAGGYQGTQTLPIYWYSVFRVKNSVPQEVSAEYQRFYGQLLLPELDFFSRLLASTCPEAAGATEARAEVRFLRAKYDRKIAGQPRAGFGDAEEWSESNNPRLQMLAVETFREMAVPEALIELKKLEKAKDYVVSQAATNAVNAKTDAHR